ncbi:MAG: ankyrin repeat domain-containing protein [Rubrivivax sp.]
MRVTFAILFALAALAAFGTRSAWAQGAAPGAPAPVPTMPSGVVAAGERPIHHAARNGDKAAVLRLLAADPTQRDQRSATGATPLHHAALNGDSGPLVALLAAGAKVDVRDGEGQTPLHLAAFATRTENVKLLLRAGADPQAKTDAGRDVLSMARKVRADETAGVISLWILKGCKADKPC